MKINYEKRPMPNPEEIETAISEFLNKKFNGNVKIITPKLSPLTDGTNENKKEQKKKEISFDLKPMELIAYLDKYIVKQDNAKRVLSTKICTHFNRIKFIDSDSKNKNEIVGNVKNNILMIGPTGVGKTYMIKLIAKKLGVPFVKGDATKFSETGYVGGDVEDLIRDLVREANDDMHLAECGIVYIDEIDKIASSRNLIGSDISHSGVQRALLKPMEETDVELKIPHDPISMMQEFERFQKTGSRDKRSVNTANILFIVSGAFSELPEVIDKRVTTSKIGFGAPVKKAVNSPDILQKMKTEDLVEFGFESEFIGRLPVRAIFEKLTKEDLYTILKTPNNPVILSKKLDFASYGIDIKFHDEALKIIADQAFIENTGARGLVGSIENILIPFESRLPSSNVTQIPVTSEVINNPDKILQEFLDGKKHQKWNKIFNKAFDDEFQYIKNYIQENWASLSTKQSPTLTQGRADLIATYFCKHVTIIENAIAQIKEYYDEVKLIELEFFNSYNINLVLEDDAVDFLIEQLINSSATPKELFESISNDLNLGLTLVHEKTGQNRFFIDKNAIIKPTVFLEKLIKKKLSIPDDTTK